MGKMASKITSPIICLLNPFFQAQIKENIKAPRHWPLCGEFTGEEFSAQMASNAEWFHLMTSSCPYGVMYNVKLIHSRTWTEVLVYRRLNKDVNG